VIYFIFVQHMQHRMQITQESSEYDFITNSMKFMQQVTSLLSEGDTIVCN